MPRLTRPLLPVIVTLAAAVSIACAAKMRSTATAPLTTGQIAQLWVEPADLKSRDLLNGPGGAARAPKPDATYNVLAVDLTGYSQGYDVADQNGRKWKVKIGDEVQPEIVASRLLWAVGFHQPPMYFVRDWRAAGVRHEHQGRAARFRLEDDYDSVSPWSWQQNPYVGTRPFKALIVANLLLNNWDLKASNNRIYDVTGSLPGPRRWFVVQDLGAALGRSKWPTGTRNDIDSFEKHGLVKRVENGIVKFDYHARHTELFRDITPGDVAWACRLFAGLTDAQWQDAFRAANYPDTLAARFITKLKSKVNEGLALADAAGANP